MSLGDLVDIRVTSPQPLARRIRPRVIFRIPAMPESLPGDFLRAATLEAAILDAERFELCCDNWPTVRGILVNCFNCTFGTIEIEHELAERDGHARTQLWTERTFATALLLHGRTVHDEIRQTLREWFEHELDESMYVSGVRRWDPHEGRR